MQRQTIPRSKPVSFTAATPAAAAPPPSPTVGPVTPTRPWRQFYLDWDWLVIVVASWLLPLLGFNLWAATYFNSELFWVLPIGALLPRFFHETHPGSRRRRAFFWTIGLIMGAGTFLDLALGRWVLTFGQGPYVGYLAGIPIEEYIFYLLGPVAMLLVYFWADEYFLRPLSPQARRRDLDASALAVFHPGAALQVLYLLVGGVALKALLHGEGSWLPLYFTFLVLYNG